DQLDERLVEPWKTSLADRPDPRLLRQGGPSSLAAHRTNQIDFREGPGGLGQPMGPQDRKSTRLNSSHVSISYAVFCLKKKKLRVDLKGIACIVARQSEG